MGKPLQQDENGNIMNDEVTKENQKGYANYEADNAKKQKEMEEKDTKFMDTIKTGAKKVRSMLGLKSGGAVSSASKRADGCAIRGKTRGQLR